MTLRRILLLVVVLAAVVACGPTCSASPCAALLC